SDRGASLHHSFGPERALLSGDALNEHFLSTPVDHRAASTAAFTASSISSKGSIPSLSRTSFTAYPPPVPWIEKKTGTFGFRASQARNTPSAMTSVRAKAPQKMTARLFTPGLAR